MLIGWITGAVCAGAAPHMRLLGAAVPCGRHTAPILHGGIPADLSWLKGDAHMVLASCMISKSDLYILFDNMLPLYSVLASLQTYLGSTVMHVSDLPLLLPHI